MSVDLEDIHVGDGFYDAIGDLVPQLSGSLWHWFIYWVFVDVEDLY